MKINNTIECTIFFIFKSTTSIWSIQFFCFKKHNINLKSNRLHWRQHHGEPWEKKLKKHQNPILCRSYKLFFGPIRTTHPLPTSKSIAFIHSWRAYKNWKKLHLGVFWKKIHYTLIQSWNWACLVFLESLEKIQITNDQNLVSRNFRN
jgi:hypothetical protein